MKNIIAILLWTCCLVCMGCTEGNKETEVVLETTAGEIRVKLYDDTPGHRDNFVKNVKDSFANRQSARNARELCVNAKSVKE